MGVLTKLLTLPVRGPVDSLVWVARQITEHADQERNSPAVLRASLAEAERQLLAGDIDEETYDAIELDLLTRLRHASAP